MVICLERGTDLHMAQLMPLQLTVSCFSKPRLVLPFWYRLTGVVPDKRAVKRVCVCAWRSGAGQVQRSDGVGHHEERVSTALEGSGRRRRLATDALRGRAPGGRQAVLDHRRQLRQGILNPVTSFASFYGRICCSTECEHHSCRKRPRKKCQR